jgi:hypothetical protein
MKKIFSLLVLLSLVGATVFAQEEAAEKAPPEVKVSGSVDTGFFVNTTDKKVSNGGKNYDDDRIISQDVENGKVLGKVEFGLTDDEKFGVTLKYSAEGDRIFGQDTFSANGWINFLDKKLKVSAGTDGLDFDISHLPVDLTAGVHFNFADRNAEKWTATEFFSETEFVVGYTMPDLFTAGVTLALDGSGDASAMYDDGWIRDLSTYVLVTKYFSPGSIMDMEADNTGTPFNDPTATKLVVNFGLKAVKDLTADLDVTVWHLGSPGTDPSEINNIYKNSSVQKASQQVEGLGALGIHAKLGYALLEGKLGLTVDPTFVLYFAKPDIPSGTDSKTEAFINAAYAPALQIVPAVSYKISDAVSAGLEFNYRTKFNFLNRIAVKPSLTWQVLPNAKIGLSFELINLSEGAAVIDFEKGLESSFAGTQYTVEQTRITTETKLTFGFTF